MHHTKCMCVSGGGGGGYTSSVQISQIVGQLSTQNNKNINNKYHMNIN